MITAVIRDCPQGGVTLVIHDSATGSTIAESYTTLGDAIDARTSLPWAPASESQFRSGVLAVAETE